MAAQTKESHAMICQTLDLSRSGFYAHRHKPRRPRAKEDAQLKEMLRESFLLSRRTYGSPRLRAALQRQGRRCGKNRIARLMRELGLQARQKRRFRPKTTESNHKLPVAENWLALFPSPDKPNQVWIADITYIPTKEGWLYLSGILDACSRRCVGWHAGDALSSSLVTKAWDKAWKDQRPGPGLLHHSDRGVQYASGAFAAQLRASGATASMSGKANCYDNAMMESFWATLKTECFDNQIPQTKAQATLMIFDYIETFYNRQRLHSALHYQSPLDFERTRSLN